MTAKWPRVRRAILDACRGPLKAALVCFMQTKLYAWILLRLLPNIRFSTSYSRMTGRQYAALYDTLEPGDIILAINYHNLTGFLIPKITGGEVSHAALCVSKGGQDYEVAEMQASGYTKAMFYDVCRNADRVIVGHCTDWDAAYKKLVVERCLTFEGVPYDIQFTLGIKSLACSELVYEADFERRLKCSLEDTAGLGRPYISPEGIRRSENFVVKADSSSMR